MMAAVLQPTAADVLARLEALSNDAQREVLMRFFKTGVGEYGEGDAFLGLRVPHTRSVAREVAAMSLDEVATLLQSQWHEARLCALLVMVDKFERLTRKRLVDDPEAVRKRDEIVDMYLANADRINNWDLVDLSAPKIVGHWLLLPTLKGGDVPNVATATKLAMLDELALCGHLWRQRIAMVSTWKTTQQGDPTYCLRYAEMLLCHPHDLMHKAVGWMLREVGKRISMNLLRAFLQKHLREMHRTTLRYAIELMSPDERREWLER